jgi:hypothetical protein
MAAAACKFTVHFLMSFSTISFHAEIPPRSQRDEVDCFSPPGVDIVPAASPPQNCFLPALGIPAVKIKLWRKSSVSAPTLISKTARK